jgi:hypothetical protein
MLQGQYVVMDGLRGAQGWEVGLPRLKLHHFLSINNKQQNKTAKKPRGSNPGNPAGKWQKLAHEHAGRRRLRQIVHK